MQIAEGVHLGRGPISPGLPFIPAAPPLMGSTFRRKVTGLAAVILTLVSMAARAVEGGILSLARVHQGDWPPTFLRHRRSPDQVPERRRLRGGLHWIATALSQNLAHITCGEELTFTCRELPAAAAHWHFAALARASRPDENRPGA